MITDGLLSRAREQSLTAMPGGQQPGDTVERRAEVVAVTQLDQAGVQRHSYAQLADLIPALSVEPALGGQSAGEGCEEGITNGSKHHAIAGDDSLAENRIVAGQGDGHCLGVLFPQPGAALDIGEEQGDHSGWQIRHGSPPVHCARTATSVTSSAWSAAPRYCVTAWSNRSHSSCADVSRLARAILYNRSASKKLPCISSASVTPSVS